MTIEQLLLLAVFVLASLLNLVVQALRRRRQAAQAPEEKAEARETRPSPLPPSAVYRETPTPARPPLRRRAEEPRVEPPPAARQRRRRPRVRFRSAAEVRRAFVLMTVLGPCRGLEPPARPRVDQPAAATGSARAG